MRQVIRPHPGPQMQFLSSSADITIFGGGAGPGKTWSLLAEPLRSLNVPDFGSVIFRRTYPQITNKGGLWDASRKIYPLLGGIPRQTDFLWRFPGGSDVRLANMQYESDVYQWQGSEIPLLEFDELTHFTEHQFWYMQSRNRSTLGGPGYTRAGTNPDADSWVALLVDWWINDEGFPIPERSGVLRYFVRINDEMIWSDDRAELEDAYPPTITEDGTFSRVKSFTFIPARVFDNPTLLRADPGYLANLESLPYVEKERLLDGNWKVKPAAGKVFRSDDFQIITDIPAGGVTVRFWDFAATEVELEKSDPDYTAGVLLRIVRGSSYILDVVAVQEGPAQVEELFYSTVKADFKRCLQEGSQYAVRWEQEPGSAGKRESYHMVKGLQGFDAMGIPSSGAKLVRARPLATQVKAKNVHVLQAAWTRSFLHHMHHQPDFPHDDVMDATAGAYNQAIMIPEITQEEQDQRSTSMSVFG
jgi:predicted phage terminase large subunit-like protein